MKPNFEKIKGLAGEIVNELGVKETLDKGVSKTKEVVEKTSERVNTYVDAIKEVRENEVREKQYGLCLEELKMLDGLTVDVLIASVEPLLYTTDVVKHMNRTSRYTNEIKRIVDKSIETILRENIEKLVETYTREIFDLTTFDFVLSLDTKSRRNLPNVAKKIVSNTSEDVVLVFKSSELTFPKGITPHRLLVTKDNVKKRVENSILYFDITMEDKVHTIQTSDMVAIDTFNSLLSGIYQSIDLLCFEPYFHYDIEENEILRTPTRSFLILSTN